VSKRTTKKSNTVQLRLSAHVVEKAGAAKETAVVGWAEAGLVGAGSAVEVLQTFRVTCVTM
jgi:hypothetical protein